MLIEDYEDAASVGSSDSVLSIFVQPEIRVFKQDGSNHVYLFYVNRQCRQTGNPMYVMINDSTIPYSYISGNALDHSRRFIIPVSNIRRDFFFDDTLEAGQARLVEFVNAGAMDADIRITDPDIVAFYSGTKKTRDFEFTAGDDIDIEATFYNMGTDSTDDVIVTCTDLTDNQEIDRDTLDFDGIPASGWECDSDNGIFTWETDSSDVGIHRLEIHAEPLNGEPDTLDNTAMAVFLIQPRDYATQVRGDAWV